MKAFRQWSKLSTAQQLAITRDVQNMIGKDGDTTDECARILADRIGGQLRAYAEALMAQGAGRLCKDKRYTVELEYTGAPTAQYVARFCGDFIGARASRDEAIALIGTHLR